MATSWSSNTEKMESDFERFTARRTESLDSQSISKLVKRATEAVFGRINVEYIIEKANLAISLASTTSHEVLGHMALLDYPSLSSVDPAHWEAWFHKHFDCPKASPMNALFLHLFVAKEGFHQGASNEILRTAFMAVPLLQYVFLTVPSGTTLGPVLEALFSPVGAKEEGATPCDLYVTHRHQHFPMLHVRTARVEDADDLMPIFQRYSADINQQYGEYFLAELIESQDDCHKTIVAEVGGHAVGFLSVSTEVDDSLLTACFQLEPLHGLQHSSDHDRDPSSTIEGSEKQHGLTDKSSASVGIQGDDGSSQQGSQAKLEHQSSAQTTPVPSQQQSLAAMTTSQTKITASRAKITSSQAKITSSQAKITSSQAKITSSQAKITSSQAKITASQAKITSSQAKITSSQAKITSSQAKITSSQTKITASPAKSTSSQAKITASPAKSTLSQDKITSSQAKITASQAKLTLSQAKLTSSQAKITQSGIMQSSASLASQSSKISLKEGSTEEPADSPVEVSSDQKPHRSRKEGCNAVAIQLFAIDERFEMRSIDFLPAVFQNFPDHDFCILSQPPSAPEFPLLTTFTRVNPRVGTSLPQELYVFHKCALLHSLAVRPVELSDVPSIAKLVSGLEGGEGVMGDVGRYVEGRRDPLGEGATPLFAAVAVCAEQVVGVAVLRQEEDMGYLRSHYNIEDFVYFSHHRPQEHGHLHHLVLNPAFAPHTKHFIKELLRLSHTSCLYYSLYGPSPPNTLKPHTVTTALGDMVPVRPRRQVQYSVEGLGANVPRGEVLEKRLPFALYHTNRKLTLEPKIPVNSRVVIVGASDTAVALLETLVFSPHLRFYNLTLVSPYGLPQYTEEDGLPHSCCYWSESYQLLGLGNWVNVVRGKMVAIERPEQYIVVEGGEGPQATVYYDHLVLCTGTQYQLPVLGQETPKHVFTFSSGQEASSVLSWVKDTLIPSGGQLVVYGSSLDVYSTVEALLRCGVPPSHLSLVHPSPAPSLNNPTVDQWVWSALQEVGVASHEGLSLQGYGSNEQEELTAVSFVGADGSTLQLECEALICLDEKHVDRLAFKAMNDACLVFDRRLVIDRDHHTNDPSILAAGPLTKFYRRYRADQWTHANFDSKEVGQKLASTLLSSLDPTLEGGPSSSDHEDSDLIPTYSQPKTTCTTLPGGLHYLLVEKPNLGQRLQTLVEHPRYGCELVTDTENGYFRLHMNQYGRIQTVTVLSRQPFEVAHCLCLYGMHEKYLNNLLSRYDEKLIPDFFCYFREPWACALFHDRFPDFMEEVREHLAAPTEEDPESLEEKVRKMVEEGQTVSLENHRSRLAEEFAVSPVRSAIQKRLFRFLHYNSYHLPMYARPDII